MANQLHETLEHNLRSLLDINVTRAIGRLRTLPATRRAPADHGSRDAVFRISSRPWDCSVRRGVIR